MPNLQLPAKFHNALYSVLTTSARIIVLVGGRGSGKSEGTSRIMVMKVQTEAADVLCGREFQNTIDESVHKLNQQVIEKLGVEGFRSLETKIDCATGGGFRYRGFARNPEGVKSLQGFKYSWIEEAQTASQQTIDFLLPTIRAEDSQLWFTANLGSSEDPFSKRFVVPYMRDLVSKGYYEDEMHLIIVVNWRDNPWFPKELEQQRQWDYDNLPRSKYDWIWEFSFNDGVEDALIQPEWFDACIDAHKKLGFEPVGMKMAAHDPSDLGGDSKGYAMRHGSVVQRVEEKTTGNVNDGCDWATGLALNDQVDGFTWDCDGMGVALNAQVAKAFEGKHTRISQFKGSEGVDFPDAIFEPADGSAVQDQKTNRQALKNKRAQYYLEFRRRTLNTYNAVVHGRYCDPDKLWSYNSATIAPGTLQKLRSEVCRMPIKPSGSGLFELYTKDEMKRKFKFTSPNLGDPNMMLTRQPYAAAQRKVMPQPIRPMGRR
jgi:phage terminase large subunit